MKKNLLFLGALFAMVLALALPNLRANSTNLGAPGFSGRPAADSSLGSLGGYRYQGSTTREIGDCSNGLYYSSVLSTTSTAINLTFTTGLGVKVNTYIGNFQCQVVNRGVSSLVIFASMTPTAMGYAASVTETGGIVILAGASTNYTVQARDGITLHMLGLTATTSASISVCTY